MLKASFRAAAAALLCLVVGIISTQVVGSVAEARSRAAIEETLTKYTSGVATIGDGQTSSGIFNANATGISGDMVKLFNTAVHHASHLHFLRGTYTFAHPIVSGRSNIEISADPGAKFVVDNDDATGLFDLSGSNTVLRDLYVSVDGWTNDQEVIKLSGAWQKIEGCTFEVTTAGGNTTTPMDLVEFSNALEPEMRRCTVLPNIGTRVLDWDHGHGGVFENNVVRNTTKTGFGGQGESLTAETRACWQVVRAIGAQNISIRQNRVWALGTVTTGELTDVFYLQRDHDGINDDLDVSSGVGTLDGQVHFEGNQIGAVASGCFLRMRGVLEYVVQGNLFGSSLATMNAAGEAAIVLDTEGATSSGEIGITGSGTITGNVFNNCAVAASAASMIYHKRAKKDLIQGNIFHLTNSTQAVMYNVDDSSTTGIQGNYFDGDEANSRWGVAIESPGTSYTVRCLSIRNNLGEGLLAGLCPQRIGDDLTQFGTGTTYDDGSLMFGSAGTIFPGIPIVPVDAAARTAAALTYPPTGSPTFETVPDCSGSYANINKAVVVLADKLQRMSSGIGSFQTPLTISITGNDTSTPTVLEACTTLQTEENAIYDLATLMNSAIGQALSPRARRVRVMSTIVAGIGAADIGGVSTADGFASFTDSSGGTPVASIPQVTNDATAASAIKLIATGLADYLQNMTVTSNLVAPTTAGV